MASAPPRPYNAPVCGFVGEFCWSDAPADAERMRRLAERLVHRGPDEAGSFASADGRCAIGFRRLAVIDRAGSKQPMSTADGRVTLAFNGEIYNYRALRDELAAAGAAFRTRGDAEVLLAAVARDGVAAPAKLTGMFAFAAYDAQRRELLLARDRFGQKPLWYAVLADRVVFASEAKALLGHPDVGRNPSREAITLYLTIGYIPSPASAFEGAAKMRPGCWLRFGPDGAREDGCYWQPRADPVEGSQADVLRQVREGVTRAVRLRMEADVPLGVLLSGGVDSAIVTSVMAEAAGRTGGVRTFTAGFADGVYDERPAARRVARRCGTEHKELLIEPAGPEAVDAIVEMYDEPFADSSALPTYQVCRAARQHVTVALAGDGGDEVFGGYDRYRALRLAGGLSPLRYLLVQLAARAMRPFARGSERSGSRRLVRFAAGARLPFAMQYFYYRALFDAAELGRLLSAEMLERVDVEAPQRWFCGLYEDGEWDSEVSRAQCHDMRTYLPDDLLVKTDIASMASSLELRAGLLDHGLAAMGLGLSEELKFRRRRGKAVLREAFADMLPRETLWGPKRGFGVPLGAWLRGPLRSVLEEALLDKGFLSAGVVRPEAVIGLLNEHLSGRRDWGHRLWALLILARWLARWS